MTGSAHRARRSPGGRGGRSSRGAHRRRDAGAVLAEAAIVLPILVTLVFGIIEFGFALRDDQLVERAAQQAARVDAGLATDRFGDFEALRIVDSTLAATRGADIVRVIVYDASTTGATVPCLDVAATDDLSPKGKSGVCNVYGPSQVATPSPTGFRSTSAALDDCTSGSWDSAWCPTDRTREGSTPDRVGVHVELRTGRFTGLFSPTDFRLRSTSVYQLEPCTAFAFDC